ncbi:MAG: MucB/RseB C-terminal domain-containing protein [Pseudomonadota bacterium]|nr:MAG: MucB/RseB C-terminal domain-containing protein [Pseudomonadota bacterium]
MKINQAARTLNYEGVFVYERDKQIDVMRIVHRYSDGRRQERLVSMNGAPREIIRNDREVICFLPDEKSVLVEHRKVDNKTFPALLPEQLQALDANYNFQLGKQARIAGRSAQSLQIKPRDKLRYGYQLWADRDTGLLLKADLLDTDGQVIEQFMFTQLAIGVSIADRALEPETGGEGYAWHREETVGEGKANALPRWKVAELPKGYRLTSHIARQIPTRRVPVEHLVYSDGLAAVSVFVEKSDKSTVVGSGVSKMGAVHAYSRRVDGHKVTVVGEVPAETVTLLGNSVASR